MKLLVVALMAEATPLIERLALKLVCKKPFLLFEGGEFVLIISGVGQLKACGATSFALTRYASIDTLVNIGVAGSANRAFCLGELFEVSKIIDEASAKMLFTHTHSTLQKAPLKSFLHPVSQAKGNYLVDLEAFAIYSCAKAFLKSEQMMFIKILSDYLEPNLVTKTHILDLINKNLDKIELLLKGEL